MERHTNTSSLPIIEDEFESVKFYTETIEIQRLSPTSFFEGGHIFSGQRFFWQNREKTFSLVGLGHAYTLEEKSDRDRFQSIRMRWKMLCTKLVKEFHDQDPILFGGFSFDAKREPSAEWTDFSSATFILPTIQYVQKGDRAFVNIHLVTTEEESLQAFDDLRKLRDEIIHDAQIKDYGPYKKPYVLQIVEREKESYLKSVKVATDMIKHGRASKVVLARSLKIHVKESVPHGGILSFMEKEQQESYLFGMEREHSFFYGATPERLVKVEDRLAYSTCLAGSIKRGNSVKEDQQLGEELLADQKNREEHQYVVNMIDRVFQKHCQDATVPKHPKLMKTRDIQHLYTPVKGELKSQAHLFDLVEELHPTPALGGEPRDEAMQMIRELESMDRGYYAAPIGWVDTNGNGEFAVAIRSALAKKDIVYLYAGGGIVADSTAPSEYEETLVKFRPMLRTVGGSLDGGL